MDRPTPKFSQALEILTNHGVEFIVVGGVAAVLAGAPISTFDLDIVVARSSENLQRLLSALNEIDARYRDLTGRVIRPELTTLQGHGHHLLLTTCGPLDILGTIGDAEGYEQLLSETVEREFAGRPLRTLGLASLIRLKETANRDKDRAVLPILRRTLAESKK